MTDRLPEPPRVDPAIVQAWRDRQLKNLPKGKLSMAEQITAANRLAALFNNPQTLTGGLTKTGAGGASVQVALDKPYKGLSTISAVAATGCDRFGRVTMLRDKNNDWYAFGGGTEKLRSDRDKERSGDDKSGEANPIKYLFSTILTTDGVRDRVFYVGGHQAVPQEIFRVPVAKNVTATLNNVGDNAVINVKVPIDNKLQLWDLNVKRWELNIPTDAGISGFNSLGFGLWVRSENRTFINGNDFRFEFRLRWVAQQPSNSAIAELFDSGWLFEGSAVDGNILSEVRNKLFRFLPGSSLESVNVNGRDRFYTFLAGNVNSKDRPTGTYTNESGSAIVGVYENDSLDAAGVEQGLVEKHAWITAKGVSFYDPELPPGGLGDSATDQLFKNNRAIFLNSLDRFTTGDLGEWTISRSAIDCLDDSFAACYLKQMWEKNTDGSIKLPNKQITKDMDWAKSANEEVFPMQVQTLSKEFKISSTEEYEVYIIPEESLPQDPEPLATPQTLSAIAAVPDVYRKVTSLNQYFLFDPASTFTADNITTIRPSSVTSLQPGRWLSDKRYQFYNYSYFPPN